MIPAGVQVFVALQPIDMRLGFERLCGLVKDRIGYDARGGALFLFHGRRRDALKVLFFDGTGLCLFYKRLDRGNFVLPEATGPDETHVEIDEASMDALLEGIQVGPAASRIRTQRIPLH